MSKEKTYSIYEVELVNIEIIYKNKAFILKNITPAGCVKRMCKKCIKISDIK